MSRSPKLPFVVAAIAALILTALLAGCVPTPADGDLTDEETASVEPTDTSETSGGGADTICDHPYFPVSDGVVLTYSQEAPGASSQMTQEFQITGEDTFRVDQVVTGEGAVLTSGGEWQCADDGLVQTSNIQLDLNVPGVEFSDIEYSGVTLPQPDAFVEGATWQSSYDAAGTAEINGVTVEYDISIAQDSTLAAFENVVVPAGTYEAARVDSTETMSIIAAGVAVPDTVSKTTVWYAEGVGVVKIETEMAGGLFTQELLSVE